MRHLKVRVDGMVYGSISEYARKLGVPYQTAYSRVVRDSRRHRILVPRGVGDGAVVEEHDHQTAIALLGHARVRA